MNERRLRIVMMEDLDSDAKLIAHALSSVGGGADVIHVVGERGFREALVKGPWDAVICDYSMPSFNALDALAILTEWGEDVPFIVVSGTIGEERAAELMRFGAHDVVLKDNLVRLAPAVAREVKETAERRARREAEAALLRQEVRYRRIVETTHEAVWTVDARGVTTFVNGRMRSIYGRTADELVGTPALELVAEASRTALERCLRSESLEAAEIELVLSCPGARPVVMQTHASTMFDEDGAVEGLLLMGRDVTAQHLAEEARQRAEEALADSEAQLRQAQKMEAIGRLAGGVAHDFNNLLSVIMSHASLLIEDLGPDHTSTPDAREILAASERAANLTRQLLSLSRHQVIEPKPVDVNDLVLAIERMCSRIVGANIRLGTRLDPQAGRVLADPTALEQVLLNLVVNARDAMPNGGTLTIETRHVDVDADYVASHFGTREGPHVQLSVIDTGVGIDPAIRERIFEPFFTTKELGRGTGLGLSMVFGIVKQVGGTIWVYSELGEGTVFKVLLPLHLGLDPEYQQPRPQAAQRGAETILLVEDDDAVREVVANALGRNGYEVVEASCGEQAMALLPSLQRLDMLLTDLMMPGMSGPELAELVRAERPGIAVLCMSGYTDGSIVRDRVMTRGLAFIEKPIVPSALMRKVSEVLSASRPARTDGAPSDGSSVGG